MGQGCCDLVWKAFLFLVLLCWSWYFSWLLHSLACMRLLTRHLMSFRVKLLLRSSFICSSFIRSFFICSFLQLFLLQAFLHSPFFQTSEKRLSPKQQKCICLMLTWKLIEQCQILTFISISIEFQHPSKPAWYAFSSKMKILQQSVVEKGFLESSCNLAEWFLMNW